VKCNCLSVQERVSVVSHVSIVYIKALLPQKYSLRTLTHLQCVSLNVDVWVSVCVGGECVGECKQSFLRAVVNFINVLRAGFVSPDPKSAKKNTAIFFRSRDLRA